MMLVGFSGPGFGDSASCGVESCLELCNMGCPAGQTYSIAADACKPSCPAGQCYDANGNCSANAAAGGTSSNPAQASTSWWQSALQSLTQGVVAGITKPSSTTPGTTVCSNGTVVAAGMPCPVPWYQTTPGVVGIVAVIGGLVYFLVKPSKPAAAKAAA